MAMKNNPVDLAVAQQLIWQAQSMLTRAAELLVPIGQVPLPNGEGEGARGKPSRRKSAEAGAKAPRNAEDSA